ncbi:MAG: sporulation transcriptional regulator SpoIIID [Bacilli bacterium]|nr:sporulation transcriptional regulator SpoIIID [Bacilli bacterium]
MNEDIIVEEYLNHFYNYKELACYLQIEEKRVRNILTSVGGRTGELVKKHTYIIEHYDAKNTNLNIKNELDEKVVSVAKYIINTKSSIRLAAKELKISKTTIGEYINDRLPSISITLYKKVFDIMQSHKTLNANHKSHRMIIEKEFELLNDGLTTSEISEQLHLSRNTVQRDLANRTEIISEDMQKKAKQKLKYNQMKMNR